MTAMASAGFGASSSSSTASPVPPEYDHLRWLCGRDQRVLCRAECAAAVREEGRLMADICGAMEVHHKAIEHCRGASEFDPDWFTLDVQDSHSRRVAILRDLLRALDAEQLPTPDDAKVADPFRGVVYSTYAATAQATVRTASGLQETDAAKRLAEHGQAAASSARTAFGNLTERFRTYSGQMGSSSPSASEPTSPADTGPQLFNGALSRAEVPPSSLGEAGGATAVESEPSLDEMINLSAAPTKDGGT